MAIEPNQKGRKSVRDTRVLFDEWVERKPVEWSEISEIPLGEFSMNMLEALQEKNWLFVTSDVGPTEDIFPVGGNHKELEYIVAIIPIASTNQTEAYYVNTEGYTYARYAARLPNKIACKLQLLGRK